TRSWEKKRLSPSTFPPDEYRLARSVQITFAMNRKFFVTALLLLAVCRLAWAEPAVESAQKKLKDDGFYYGEINGKKDADTTAAIRRYQIRNGLQINGELNPETLRALGLASKSSTPAPRPAQTPGPTPPGFLEETPGPTVTPPPRQQPQPEPNVNDDEYAPEPPRPRVESANTFGGPPYDAAPPQVQQDIVARA